MKKNVIIFLSFIGLIGFLSSCEKDETKVVTSNNPIVPTIKSLPNLALNRSISSDTLVFAGTPVDPGFQASANYFLEACAGGNEFKNLVILFSAIQDTSIKITVSELNGKLLQKLPENQVSSVDFRIRAVLVVDGGTGAPGTGTELFEYISDIITSDVTIYGPPTIFLTGDVNKQGISSSKNDSIYMGWVLCDGTPLTFTNNDNGDIYGVANDVVSVNGPAIALDSGFYKITINLNDMSFTSSLEDWGIIGSAIPPYDWSADVNMIYKIETKMWEITGNFVAGEYKFRANDKWDLNFGDDGANGSLEQGGANIALPSAGNYTISLDLPHNTHSAVKN